MNFLVATMVTPVDSFHANALIVYGNNKIASKGLFFYQRIFVHSKKQTLINLKITSQIISFLRKFEMKTKRGK